jgi:hypothetical protein
MLQGGELGAHPIFWKNMSNSFYNVHKKKLQALYTLGLMSEVSRPYLEINQNFTKASLNIWELNNKVTSWGASLKDKDDDPEFQFSYKKLETNEYL